MASATNDAFRALAEGHRLMSEQLRHMSTTLDHLRVLLEVKARERQAAVRLQAAARGLLARRLLQTLRGEKSSEEQAAVRLQAAGRGFLVRRAVRKMHMLLSLSLQCAISHSSSPIRPAAPIEIEVRVWGLPARRPTSATQHAPTVVAASVVLAPALVLDRSSVRPSTLHLTRIQRFGSFHGIQEDIVVVQIYFLFSFSITKISRDVKGLTLGCVK